MADMSQPPMAPVPGPVAAPVPYGMLEHPVGFDAAKASGTVRAAARNRTWRIISVGISVAISAAIWWFFREQFGDMTWSFVAVALIWPLSSLAWAVVREVITRRDARHVDNGLALGIGRLGLFLRGTAVPWTHVGAVRAESGRLGASDRLVVETRDKVALMVPLDYLTAGPATIDGAIFALSGGRVRVDFSGLDV